MSTRIEETVDLRAIDAEVGREVFKLKVFKPSEVIKSLASQDPDKLYWQGVNDYYYIPSGKPPRTHMIDARPVPHFSSNISATFEMEEKIKELGLVNSYTKELGKIVFGFYGVLPENEQQWFALIHASAEQRARAALLTIQHKLKEQP